MKDYSKEINRLSRTSIFLTNLVESLKSQIICEVLVTNQLEIINLKKRNKKNVHNSIEDSIAASKQAIAALNACKKREDHNKNT